MVVSIRYHAKLTGNGRFRSSRADFEQSQSREGERRRGAVSTEEGRKKMREKKRTWISSRAVGFIAWSPRQVHLRGQNKSQSCLARRSSPKGMVVSDTSSGKNAKRKVAPTGQISKRDKS
ncbi:hypothetical protein BHM03_00055551 [Ensete ventricosum]|nr:hypothetical protein BHM03_00055551 [Ensete ventricosum]